jgi:hypothetical protein
MHTMIAHHDNLLLLEAPAELTCELSCVPAMWIYKRLSTVRRGNFSTSHQIATGAILQERGLPVTHDARVFQVPTSSEIILHDGAKMVEHLQWLKWPPCTRSPIRHQKKSMYSWNAVNRDVFTHGDEQVKEEEYM